MDRDLYSQDDWEFVNSILLAIQGALFGEVIPSLRQIVLKWKPGDKKFCVYFFHHGEITANIEDHYSRIMTEVDGDFCFLTDFEVIRCDYPKTLPNEGYDVTAYRRKEPFVDPI